MVSDKFKEEIVALVGERMGDAHVREYKAAKNNSVCLAGIIIQSQDSNIAPCVYLEDFYKDYLEGRKNMEEIADEIVQRCHRDSIMEKLELPVINEYPGVKSLLHGMLVNTERNRETLGKIPHREFLDLSLVYCVEFPFQDSGGTGSVQVTDGLMELWGKTEPDLYGQAMENMVGSDMADLFSMADIFKGIQGYIPNGIPGEAFPMYILTNQRRFHGAAQILNNRAMEQAEKQVGQDFFILPSSIHETILVPAGKTNADARELAAIVHEVNGTCVLGEEFLSDHVYQHCAADGRIKIVA